MAKRLLSRLGQLVFVLWLLVTVMFFVVNLAGDPTQQMAMDPNIPPEARELQIQRLGLDQPMHIQYWTYLTGLLQGDMGVSFHLYPREVSDIIVERLPRTFGLLLVATVVSIVAGFAVGKRVAWLRGTRREHGATIVAVFLLTVFPVWAALVMIWIFAFELDWFPSRGFITTALWRGGPYAANEVFIALLLSITALLIAAFAVFLLSRRFDAPWMRTVGGIGGLAAVVAVFLLGWSATPMAEYAANIAYHTVLPTLTLTLLSFGGTMLLTRTAMMETMQEDFVLTARAKGLSERAVRDKHVARTALNPVVASFLISLVTVITGSIVFEQVFSWPGMGLTLLNAATEGDVPLAIGGIISLGFLFMIVHFLLDLVYSALDPRLRT